ncbi:PIN domain-containing protein [Streptomyces sp. O3]
MILIADTGGLIAALNPDDKDHAGSLDALTRAGLVILSPLAVTEVHQVVTSRAGRDAADRAIRAIARRIRSGRFQFAELTAGVLERALTVREQYSGLDLDLADAVVVVLAAEHGTNEILTVDRRDFRAMAPITGHTAFRLLPDDL